MLLATSKLLNRLNDRNHNGRAQVACAAAISSETEVHTNLNKSARLAGPSRHLALQERYARALSDASELLKDQNSSAYNESTKQCSAKYVTISESPTVD